MCVKRVGVLLIIIKTPHCAYIQVSKISSKHRRNKKKKSKIDEVFWWTRGECRIGEINFNFIFTLFNCNIITFIFHIISLYFRRLKSTFRSKSSIHFSYLQKKKVNWVKKYCTIAMMMIKIYAFFSSFKLSFCCYFFCIVKVMQHCWTLVSHGLT